MPQGLLRRAAGRLFPIPSVLPSKLTLDASHGRAVGAAGRGARQLRNAKL